MVDSDDRFVEEWRPFVAKIAHKLTAELDLTVDLDDLLSAGFGGLLEARRRYDPSRGVQLNTFAYYRVRGAMIDAVRKGAFLPRRAYARLRAAEAADVVGEAAGEARAADARGRTDLGATVDALDGALAQVTASFVIAAVGQDAVVETPEESLVEAEGAARVRAALATLPERERALVEGFYFEGRRFDEVAEELGISKSWASRLHGKALTLLREALAAGEPSR